MPRAGACVGGALGSAYTPSYLRGVPNPKVARLLSLCCRRRWLLLPIHTCTSREVSTDMAASFTQNHPRHQRFSVSYIQVHVCISVLRVVWNRGPSTPPAQAAWGREVKGVEGIEVDEDYDSSIDNEHYSSNIQCMVMERTPATYADSSDEASSGVKDSRYRPGVLSRDLLVGLQDPDKFCDLTLICSDEGRLPAIRSILAMRSPVLERMLLGSFQEAQSDEIRLYFPSRVLTCRSVVARRRPPYPVPQRTAPTRRTRR